MSDNQIATQPDFINEGLHAKMLARRKILTKLYTTLLEDEMWTEMDKSMIGQMVGARDLNKYHDIVSSRDVKDKGPWVLITINPKKTVFGIEEGHLTNVALYEFLSEDFVYTINKSLAKKWIGDYIWCLETRGLDEHGQFTGIHCHMFLNRGNKSPFELVREFKNTFKDICDVDNIHCLNFKYFSDDKSINGFNYVSGLKNGAPKEHAETDKLFREEYCMSMTYRQPCLDFA